MSPSPLKTLFWNITYNCNYHCEICFTDAGHTHQNELTTKEAFEAISRIRNAGIRDVIISGGEPFIREDIVDILKCMAASQISARIATNGSLLTKEILQTLKSETLTKSFQVSLDTLDPRLYSRIHGTSPQMLKHALEVLEWIQEAKFHTTVSVRLTPQTLPGIPALLDRASAEGWATVTVHCPVHTRRVKGAYDQDADVLTTLEPALEYFCRLPQKWLIETYIPWAEYHPVMRNLKDRVRLVHRGCRAGRDRLTINPTGQLSPCVCMDIPEAYVGNIKEDNLEEVYEHSTLCDMLRHPSNYGICLECSQLKKCGGGCRASAFAISGQMNAQDQSCPVWKKRAGRKDSIHHELRAYPRLETDSR